MSSSTPEMVHRVDATRLTVAQFQDRPFRLGHRDCCRMVAAHLAWFGHDVSLPPAGSYRSRKQALKLLADRGYANLYDALDKLGFERIAPAAATVGDILALPAVDVLGALAIALGNGRILGYHPHARGAAALAPKLTEAAWRIHA